MVTLFDVTNYVADVGEDFFDYWEEGSADIEITQEAIQAASAAVDVNQFMGMNLIGGIEELEFEPGLFTVIADESYFSQDFEQIATSDVGNVIQISEGNFITDLTGDVNEVEQSILQAGLSDSQFEPLVIQDTAPVNIDLFGFEEEIPLASGNFVGLVNGDLNELEQQATQIVTAEDGLVYQGAEEANEIEELDLDFNLVDQFTQQYALAGDLFQDGSGANVIEVDVAGDENTIFQELDQVAVSNTGEIIQDAAHNPLGTIFPGNNLPVVIGEDVFVSQDIEQFASSSGPITQGASNYLGDVDTAADDFIPELDQLIEQVAVTTDDLEQAATNYLEVDTDFDVLVNQNIADTVQWGETLDRDAYNYVLVFSDLDATVNQQIDHVNVGTDPNGEANSVETNEIDFDVAGELTANQNIFPTIAGVFANFDDTPLNIVTPI